MPWVSQKTGGLCALSGGIVIALLVAFAVRERVQRNAEQDRNLCYAQMRAMTVHYLCLTGVSRERMEQTDWRNPREALETLMGRLLPKCPSGGKYTITYRHGNPGPTDCVCSHHGVVPSKKSIRQQNRKNNGQDEREKVR